MPEVRNSSLFFSVSAIVITLHVLLGIFSFFSLSSSVNHLKRNVIQSRKLSIQTVSLSPTPSLSLPETKEITKKNVVAQQPKPKTSQPSNTLPKPKSAVETPQKKTVVDKPKLVAPVKQVKEVKAPQPVSVREPEKMSQRDAQLLAEIQGKLANVKTTSMASVVKSVPIVSVISSDASESSDQNGDFQTRESYAKALGDRLRKFLQLPDYGNVKIELTINRMGVVTRVKILQHESEANRQYVETSLPKLKFPPLLNHFAGESEHTFALTLSNAL